MTSDPIDQRALVRIDRIPLGMLYMTGATLMFAISSALSKWQVSIYSFDEVLFMRAIVSVFVCAAIILPRTGQPCSRFALRNSTALRVAQRLSIDSAR